MQTSTITINFLRSLMLFESIDLGHIRLANRTVMAPMTRSRCTHNSALMHWLPNITSKEPLPV
jgi:2,4-dienoyl-CoA reductase-like NADH-dependent reductase (Old Yellow Enzyme family)